MSRKSFTELKTEFYAKAGHISVFEGKYANYIKVALDGYQVNYLSKGKFGTPIFSGTFPYLFHTFIKFFQALFNGKYSHFQALLRKAETNKEPDILLLDIGRTSRDENGNLVSVYFHEYVQKLRQENKVYYASEIEIEGYKDYQDIYDARFFKGVLFKAELQKFRKDFEKVLTQLETQTEFDVHDLGNFRCAFQILFDGLLFWYPVLKKLRPKTIYFLCHYHKEGFILAAKSLGIPLVELQHGLIAKSDIFYNFPEPFLKHQSRALMADEMWTFGNYWSEILKAGNAYSPNQISTLGYYLYSRSEPSNAEKEHLKHFIGNREVVLITTQTALSQPFVDYVQQLRKNLEDRYCVIIKPHPFEDRIPYQVFEGDASILLSEFPLEVLFPISKYHITIYSTTAFDALRYGLPTYFLFEPSCVDYIENIREELGGVMVSNDSPPPWEIENPLTAKADYFYANKSQ